MVSVSRRATSVLGLLLLALGQADSSAASHTLLPRLDISFRRAAAVVADARLPGEMLLADAKGNTRTVAFGLADRKSGKRNKVGQRWLWASITKQVTATLVLQEVDRGRIALDDPVGTHLPGFRGDRAITIRQLLQHQSGLPNPSDTPPANGIPAFYLETGTAITNRARTDGFCAGAPKSTRGGAWEYNNCDYLVLGAVLEAVTGTSFAQLFEARIARPLGMRTARLAADRARRGGATAINYHGQSPSPEINVATGGAAAALTGSARDLALFDKALMNGLLLTPATRMAAWSGDPRLGFMALGVWSYSAELKGCPAPVALVERRGDFGGTQVRNVIAPALGRAVILFTNDSAADFGEVWQGRGLTFDLLSASFCADGN